MSRLPSPCAIFLCAAAAGCADFSRPATFPLGAADRPVVQEQALLGLSREGHAAVAELIAAELDEPRLTLFEADPEGGPPVPMLDAEPAVARAVLARVEAQGARLLPVLGPEVAALWPEAPEKAARAGFIVVAEAVPEPSRRRYPIPGAAPLSLPLSLRLAELGGAPPMQALLLGEMPGGQSGGDELVLLRMPLSGATIAPRVWAAGGAAWMLAGSVRANPQEPLRRAVGLRGARLTRGEAELHNGHGLADYGAGELDAARREFDRALAADPRFVDALYNAASVAALEDRTDDAIALLRRATAVDARRVQVLGRDDDDLRVLRRRPDVRALLGLVRKAPDTPARPGP